MSRVLPAERRAASILGALAILLGRSWVASACTLAPYEDVFVPSGTVPADGFAAEIGDPAWSMPALLDDAGTPVELMTAPGPATRWTVRAAQALEPGAHYTFRYQLARRFDSTDTVAKSVDLTAGPFAPAPDSAGALRVEADPAAAASAAPSFLVQWDRAPALQPYASLLEIHFMVDGMILSTLSSSESAATVTGMCDRPEPILDSCGDVFGVPAGHHTVTVAARLFGSASPLPPPSTSVDVPCTPTPVDHGVTGTQAGCAVAAGSADAAPPALAAAVMLLWLARSRRKALRLPA